MSRHKQRRDAWLAAGKCPMCAAHDDLIPGMCFCAKCRARMAGKPRKTAKVRPEANVVVVAGPSIWETAQDSLALAIRQAEQDLQAEAS